MYKRQLQYPLNENSSVQNRRNLIDKTPKRTGEELVPTTPFCSYTAWVNDPPGSATMDPSERDHWTSLYEIPTPKNRTDTYHSAPRLLSYYPKILNPWLRSCQILNRYVPLYIQIGSPLANTGRIHTPCLLYTSRCV